MVITYAVILFGLLFLIPPLRRNNFYILHAVLLIGLAYYLENVYGIRAKIFGYKTLMFFVVLHVVSINITTFFAYYHDKKAAVRGAWRVPEMNLHTLEFLGGWGGAMLAQKLFRHKTSKKRFMNMFYLMIIMEFTAVYIILKYLGFI